MRFGNERLRSPLAFGRELNAINKGIEDFLRVESETFGITLEALIIGMPVFEV